MKSKGVTVIELGVVMALIGLISVLLFPLVRTVREKIYRIRCTNNLQKISLALREYAVEHNENLPPDLNLVFEEGYLNKEDVFDCPFDAHEGNVQAPDYVYVKGHYFNSSKNPVIVYDKESNHGNKDINALLLNGEVVRRPGAMAE